MIVTELAMTLPHLVAATADHVISAVPNPGSGTAPPGSDRLTTLLKWAAWTMSAACVLGVLTVGGLMGLSVVNGNQHNNPWFNKLGAILIGGILIGSASALVGAMI